MFFDINKYRYEYLLNKINKNDNIVLTWGRNKGKTKYFIYYLIEYMINNKNTKSLILTHNKKTIDNIFKIIYFYINYHNLKSIDFKSFNKNKIIFKNNSMILFEDAYKVHDNSFFNNIIIDEFDFFNIYELFGNLQIYNFNKLLINGVYNNDHKLLIKKYLNNNVYFDKYINDDILNIFIRKNKIKKLKAKIKI